MSTRFKQLERVDSAAARELEKEVNNIVGNARRMADEARRESERDAERKINRMRQENSRREREIINKLKEDTKNKLAQQEARHRENLMNISNDLNEQLSKQSKEFKENLKKTREKTSRDLNSLRIETQNLIQTHREEVQEAIRTQSRVIEDHQTQINVIKDEINQVDQHVRSIQSDINAQKMLADEWIRECKRMIDEYEDDLAVKRFQEKELNSVKNLITSTENTIEIAPQAAIASLTQARLNLIDIKTVAVTSQEVFNSLYQDALSEINSLLGRVGKNKTETKIEDVNVDLSYWTDNKYVEFEERTILLQEKVENILNDKNTNIDNLMEILEEVKKMEAEEEILVIEATTNIKLSQDRVETANDVISILEGHGNFKIKDEEDGYVGGDMREGYYATLVDRNNEDVSLTVLVESDKEIPEKAIVNIQRNDETELNEGMLQDMRDTIAKSLENNNEEIKVNINEVPNNKVFDENALKNQKLSSNQKTKLKTSSRLI